LRKRGKKPAAMPRSASQTEPLKPPGSSNAANRSRQKQYDNKEIGSLSERINGVRNKYKNNNSYTKNQATIDLNAIHEEIDNLVANFAQEIAINFGNQGNQYNSSTLATRNGKNPISNWSAIRKKLIEAKQLNRNLQALRSRVQKGEKNTPVNNGDVVTAKGVARRMARKLVSRTGNGDNNTRAAGANNAGNGPTFGPRTKLAAELKINNTNLTELRNLVNKANKGNLATNAVLQYMANARKSSNGKRYSLKNKEARKASVTRAIANMKKSINRNSNNNVQNLNTALGGFGEINAYRKAVINALKNRNMENTTRTSLVSAIMALNSQNQRFKVARKIGSKGTNEKFFNLTNNATENVKRALNATQQNNANFNAVRSALRQRKVNGKNINPNVLNKLTGAIMELGINSQNKRIKVAQKIAKMGTNGKYFNLSNNAKANVTKALAAVNLENNAGAAGTNNAGNGSKNAGGNNLMSQLNLNKQNYNELVKMIKLNPNRDNISANAVIQYIINARKNTNRASNYKLNSIKNREAAANKAIANMKNANNRRKRAINTLNLATPFPNPGNGSKNASRRRAAALGVNLPPRKLQPLN